MSTQDIQTVTLKGATSSGSGLLVETEDGKQGFIYHKNISFTDYRILKIKQKLPIGDKIKVKYKSRTHDHRRDEYKYEFSLVDLEVETVRDRINPAIERLIANGSLDNQEVIIEKVMHYGLLVKTKYIINSDEVKETGFNDDFSIANYEVMGFVYEDKCKKKKNNINNSLFDLYNEGDKITVDFLSKVMPEGQTALLKVFFQER